MIHLFDTVTELYRELTDLPHATKGDPEDADTTADDHASDGLRYLLSNLGTGPEFVILDEIPDPVTVVAEPFAGVFAVRRDPEDSDWWSSADDEDGPKPGGVVTVE